MFAAFVIFAAIVEQDVIEAVLVRERTAADYHRSVRRHLKLHSFANFDQLPFDLLIFIIDGEANVAASK